MAKAINLRPSQNLLDYIFQLDEHSMPENIRKIYLSKHKTIKQPALFDDIIPNIKFTDAEVKILKDLNSVESKDTVEALTKLKEPEESKASVSPDHILERNDIKWLHQVLTNHRKNSAADVPKVYLHELLAGCELVLPENEIIPRNPVLEERCKKLRLQQMNREYHEMTKNVDNVRRNMPEDTIAFQSKHPVLIWYYYFHKALYFLCSETN
jgi:TMEM199 family protein